jgi:hypothetical protein
LNEEWIFVASVVVGAWQQLLVENVVDAEFFVV